MTRLRLEVREAGGRWDFRNSRLLRPPGGWGGRAGLPSQHPWELLRALEQLLLGLEPPSQLRMSPGCPAGPGCPSGISARTKDSRPPNT